MRRWGRRGRGLRRRRRSSRRRWRLGRHGSRGTCLRWSDGSCRRCYRRLRSHRHSGRRWRGGGNRGGCWCGGAVQEPREIGISGRIRTCRTSDQQEKEDAKRQVMFRCPLRQSFAPSGCVVVKNRPASELPLGGQGCFSHHLGLAGYRKSPSVSPVWDLTSDSGDERGSAEWVAVWPRQNILGLEAKPSSLGVKKGVLLGRPFEGRFMATTQSVLVLERISSGSI